jgi:subtilase family serine protease
MTNHIAIISLRNGPGPAVRVCPDGGPGLARCLAWKRTDVVKNIGPIGYSPANLQSAYSLTAFSSANGAGQIVAIVDAFDDPNAESDMAFYRLNFALPACTTANGCFLKVNESGSTSPLPGTDSTGGWEAEESLDLDMVSAICPNCSILLIEGNTAFTNDLFAAEDTATTTCTTSVVSNSWGAGEYASEASDETHFNHPGIMITVAAGDSGYPLSGFPAASQFVTTVGGTHLTKVGSAWTESTWAGSGSMCSLYITQPAWQTALGAGYTSICAKRIDNDVSAVADPNTGVAVYDTFGGSGGCSAWCQFGGTSASAPIIGAVYALAGNGSTNVYGSFPYAHTGSLTDVTSGSNGSCGANFLCTAGAGYDGPTGLGSPIGIGAF